MKKDFCVKCQIYCANEDSASVDTSDQQHNLNWNKPCPEGWMEVNRGDEVIYGKIRFGVTLGVRLENATGR